MGRRRKADRSEWQRPLQRMRFPNVDCDARLCVAVVLSKILAANFSNFRESAPQRVWGHLIGLRSFKPADHALNWRRSVDDNVAHRSLERALSKFHLFASFQNRVGVYGLNGEEGYDRWFLSHKSDSGESLVMDCGGADKTPARCNSENSIRLRNTGACRNVMPSASPAAQIVLISSLR